MVLRKSEISISREISRPNKISHISFQYLSWNKPVKHISAQIFWIQFISSRRPTEKNPAEVGWMGAVRRRDPRAYGGENRDGDSVLYHEFVDTL